MLGLVVRRLLFLPVVLVVAALVTYVLGVYGPGDPAQVIAGPRAVSQERLDSIRHERGLDRPIPEQFADYVLNAIQGDFGESYRFQGRSVSELLSGRIWRSFQLNFLALLGTLILGLPLGVVVARLRGTWIDHVLIGVTQYIGSVPVFVMIPIVFTIFVRGLHVFPALGFQETPIDLGFAQVPVIFLTPWMLMPVGVLVLYGLGGTIRIMRASVVDVIGQDFIRTAWAKGLTTRRVWYDHILRNALIPIVTLVALSLSGLLAGSFFVESLFGIPGVGRLLLDSVSNRDYPVIMATTLLYAGAFVLSNILADIVYGLVDPRIRVS